MPSGFTSTYNPLDCDDGNASINPNTIWFKDADSDGFYPAGGSSVSCNNPFAPNNATYVSIPGIDCNDNDPTITICRLKPRMGVDVAYSNFYPYGSITNVSGGTLNLKWSIPNVREWLIATGDINGDGKVEIVAVDAVNKRLKAISYSGTILWDIAIPSASYVVPPFLENVQGDSSPEILVGYRDTSNNLKVDVYDGNGNLIKTLNAGLGGWDSFCAPFMVKGDTVFLWCQAGYSCSPRGLKALSYSGANVVWENISGNSLGGDPYSVADIDNDDVLDISIPSFTPHGCCK
jgi:hypothetical protein